MAAAHVNFGFNAVLLERVHVHIASGDHAGGECEGNGRSSQIVLNFIRQVLLALLDRFKAGDVAHVLGQVALVFIGSIRLLTVIMSQVVSSLYNDTGTTTVLVVLATVTKR